MNIYTENGPICSYCGKSLTLNDSTGQYECLACTFRSMDDEKIIDLQNEQSESRRSEAESEYVELIRIREFQRALQESEPKLVVTKALIALNVMMHIYAMQISKNYDPKHLDQMYVDLGANVGHLIFSGEWWRIITSMFLHGGLTHLAFNMYALWVIGNIVEKLYGRFGYTVIYFVTGIGGSMLSLYNHPPNASGVGASGAVFGIFGALISYAYFKKMPKQIASGILKNAGVMIVINLAIGLSIPQIDNSAHIGGCITGIIAAYFIGQDVTKVNEKKRKLMSLGVVVFTVVFVIFTWGFIGEKNSSNKDERLVKIKEKVLSFDKLLKKCFNDYNAYIEQLQPEQVADKIDNEISVQIEEESLVLIKTLKANSVTDEYLSFYTTKIDLSKKFWKSLSQFHRTGDQTYKVKASRIINEIKELDTDDSK